jgi:hypothetical protein
MLMNFSEFRHACKQVLHGKKMCFRYSSWREDRGKAGYGVDFEMFSR